MIRQNIREVRILASLVARSVDSDLHTKQDELDILEMLRITEYVITQRLEAGVYNERQKDKKKKYVHLFRSIRAEVVEAVREVFTDEDTKKASGLVLQKYNTLVLDALFNVFAEVGPANTIRVVRSINLAIRRDIMKLDVMDHMDATIASSTLAKLSRERARRPTKKLTKAQRLAAIDAAVQKLKEVEEVEED